VSSSHCVQYHQCEYYPIFSTLSRRHQRVEISGRRRLVPAPPLFGAGESVDARRARHTFAFVFAFDARAPPPPCTFGLRAPSTSAPFALDLACTMPSLKTWNVDALRLETAPFRGFGIAFVAAFVALFRAAMGRRMSDIAIGFAGAAAALALAGDGTITTPIALSTARSSAPRRGDRACAPPRAASSASGASAQRSRRAMDGEESVVSPAATVPLKDKSTQAATSARPSAIRECTHYKAWHAI